MKNFNTNTKNKSLGGPTAKLTHKYDKKMKIVLILIVFIIIGGFYLWNKNQTKQFDSSTQTDAVILGLTHKKFTHPYIKFSLEYPKELEIERFEEKNNAETIVFSNNSEIEDEKLGFQIFISEFGEDETLTEERILEDLPFAIIEESIEIVLGDGTTALLFWSETPEIGRTREVWFVNSGNLYEVTTFARLDSWLAEIMDTWNFNEI